MQDSWVSVHLLVCDWVLVCNSITNSIIIVFAILTYMLYWIDKHLSSVTNDCYVSTTT